MKTLIKKLNTKVLILTSFALLAVVGCSEKKDNAATSSTRYQYSNGYCVDTQGGNQQVANINCNNVNGNCSNGRYQQAGGGCYDSQFRQYVSQTYCQCNGTFGGQCNGNYCSNQGYGCGVCQTVNGINNCTGYWLAPQGTNNYQLCQ